MSLYESVGETHAAARVSGELAIVERWQGDFDAALKRMERAYEVLADDVPDEDLALLVARLGSAYVFSGDSERALELLERASEMGESLGSAEVLGTAFASRSMLALAGGRPQEGLAFLKQALALAVDHDLEALGSIYFNLSDRAFHADRYADALAYLEDALAWARRRGSRRTEWAVLAETTYPLAMLGRWDEALAVAAEIPEDRLQEQVTLSLLTSVLEIHVQRGRPEEARRLLSLYPDSSPDVQEQSSYVAARSAVLRAEGRLEEALAAGLASIESPAAGGSVLSYQQAKQGFVHAVEAALALGRRGQAEELLARVEARPPGLRPPYLDAQVQRIRGRIERDADRLALAADRFRELGMPFWVAVTELEHAELLGDGDGGGDQAARLAGEAAETFTRLGAAPWLERLAAAGEGERPGVPAAS